MSTTTQLWNRLHPRRRFPPSSLPEVSASGSWEPPDMPDAPLTDRFIDALRTLEEARETSALCGLFAEGAELHRPMLERTAHAEPSSDPDAFWRSYRDQFDHISSEFTLVDDSGDTAVLEWTSTGS